MTLPQPDLTNPSEVIEFLLADIKCVVRIHHAMFEKLLSGNMEIPLELAEIFEDVANRYLDISEAISELHRPQRQLQVE